MTTQIQLVCVALLVLGVAAQPMGLQTTVFAMIIVAAIFGVCCLGCGIFWFIRCKSRKGRVVYPVGGGGVWNTNLLRHPARLKFVQGNRGDIPQGPSTIFRSGQWSRRCFEQGQRWGDAVEIDLQFFDGLVNSRDGDAMGIYRDTSRRAVILERSGNDVFEYCGMYNTGGEITGQWGAQGRMDGVFRMRHIGESRPSAPPPTPAREEDIVKSVDDLIALAALPEVGASPKLGPGDTWGSSRSPAELELRVSGTMSRVPSSVSMANVVTRKASSQAVPSPAELELRASGTMSRVPSSVSMANGVTRKASTQAVPLPHSGPSTGSSIGGHSAGGHSAGGHSAGGRSAGGRRSPVGHNVYALGGQRLPVSGNSTPALHAHALNKSPQSSRAGLTPQRSISHVRAPGGRSADETLAASFHVLEKRVGAHGISLNRATSFSHHPRKDASRLQAGGVMKSGSGTRIRKHADVELDLLPLLAKHGHK